MVIGKESLIPAREEQMDSIVVDSVTYRYPSSAPRVLDNLSFSLPVACGITGLLGKNGSGKSTLLDCLSGIVRPQLGRIELMGNMAGTMAAKRITGISFQNPSFPPNIKVHEIIGSLFTLRGIEVSSARIKQWAEEFLLADTLINTRTFQHPFGAGAQCRAVISCPIASAKAATAWLIPKASVCGLCPPFSH